MTIISDFLGHKKSIFWANYLKQIGSEYPGLDTTDILDSSEFPIFHRTEGVTAVAAAAYAILSVEESGPIKNVDHPETSLFQKTKNVKEDNRTPTPRPAPEPDKIPQPFSVNSEQEKQRPIEYTTNPSPAAINNISGGGRTEPERAVAVPGKPQTLPSETKADLWEKAELGKIQERYQKVDERICYWESKKKDKAMRKFEASQAEGMKKSKRIKGRRKLEEDMEFIKKIGGEARTKAEQKKKKEILKAKQRADIIRQTGKLPLACCC
ncbi:hypothetical protein SDJN03_06696, partial [Cucurbita argyrosperma subsp. sororia]